MIEGILWACIGAFGVVLCAMAAALYSRLTGLLDETAARLDTVADKLADHTTRIAILEVKQ